MPNSITSAITIHQLDKPPDYRNRQKHTSPGKLTTQLGSETDEGRSVTIL